MRLLVVVLVAAAAAVLLVWRDPRPQPATDQPPTSTAWIVPNLPVELTAATVAVRAARQPAIQLTEPPPAPFDPVAYVNSLDYRAVEPAPAMDAYRTVAAWYGWDPATVEARAAFVYQIMGTESAYCWNARRWTYFTAGKPCTEHRTGTHDDAGFGQITAVLRPLTCERASICTTAETVASPWNSMVAFVVVLDALGSGPWCYRGSHHRANGDCARWPG